MLTMVDKLAGPEDCWFRRWVILRMVQVCLVDLTLRRWVRRCRADVERKERSSVRGGKGGRFKYFLAMKLQARTTPPSAPLTAISQWAARSAMFRDGLARDPDHGDVVSRAKPTQSPIVPVDRGFVG